MVLILDGILEVGARVRRNLCNLIRLRDLIRSRAVTNRIFKKPKRRIFLHACVLSCHVVVVYHVTIVAIGHGLLKKFWP